MQIHIDNVLRFSWPEPASGVVAVFRLTPRQTDRQQTVNWRVDVDADGSLTQKTDAYGNLCHIFYADRPLERMEMEVNGVVNTLTSTGVETGFEERLPPAIYRRSTPRTAVTPAIALFAESYRREDRIETLHALMAGIHERIGLVEHNVCKAAEEALSGGKGRAEDLAHLFIAAARHLGYPARFLCGHLVEEDRKDSGHAWAQAYIEGLGWTHFDPSLDVSVTEAHLGVAIGLDSHDAVPARLTSRNGGAESLVVGMRGRENAQELLQRQS